MTLGERVRMARAHAKLTQVLLAEATGMKQQVLSKLENDKITETAAIVKLAIACGVRPEWLDQESGPMLNEDPFAGLPEDRRLLIFSAVRRWQAAPVPPALGLVAESTLRLLAQEPLPQYDVEPHPEKTIAIHATIKKAATS